MCSNVLVVVFRSTCCKYVCVYVYNIWCVQGMCCGVQLVSQCFKNCCVLTCAMVLCLSVVVGIITRGILYVLYINCNTCLATSFWLENLFVVLGAMYMCVTLLQSVWYGNSNKCTAVVTLSIFFEINSSDFVIPLAFSNTMKPARTPFFQSMQYVFYQQTWV